MIRMTIKQQGFKWLGSEGDAYDVARHEPHLNIIGDRGQGKSNLRIVVLQGEGHVDRVPCPTDIKVIDIRIRLVDFLAVRDVDFIVFVRGDA